MSNAPKNLLLTLGNLGLLEYGSVIQAETVRDILGIEYPEYGTKKQFDELALRELGAIDYVRNALLNDGKYISMASGNYRILLPSENAQQVSAYMSQADRKLRRAQRLSKNTPTQNDGAIKHKTESDARIHMKQSSHRRATSLRTEQIPVN